MSVRRDTLGLVTSVRARRKLGMVAAGDARMRERAFVSPKRDGPVPPDWP